MRTPARVLKATSWAALVITAAVTAVVAVAGSATAAATTPKVTAWIPYWDQPRAMQSFATNADLYWAASPFWYELSTSGGITNYPNAEDAGVLATIRSKGVKVIPTITNDFDPARASTMLASTTALRLTNTGLTRGRTYWYVVRALDNAGNRSVGSVAVSAVAK